MKFIRQSYHFFGALCGACLFIFFTFTQAYAAPLGIAVDQTSIAFDVDSGANEEFVIKVTNISDRSQEVFIGALDYAIGNNNDVRFDTDVDEENGIQKWTSTDQSQITLSPQESRDIIFKFDVPETASVGSHRGAVFFRTALDDSGDVSVQGQIAVHVLVNVKGSTHASGRLNIFDIPLFVIGEVAYEAEFENMGNIHYVPYGEVVVKNVFTKKEEMYKYPKHFVFPERSVLFSIKDELPSIFGLYRAQANFVDGEGVVRSRSDYAMGSLFPLVVIAAGVVSLIVSRWVRAKRVENDKKRSTHHQKNRFIQNLQKLFDQKRKKGDSKIKKDS
jgi:hypothetical protein